MRPSFIWSDELYHYNVRGSHWGERRYQNEDGSLTPLGRIHYGIGAAREKLREHAERKAQKKQEKETKKIDKKAAKGNKSAIKKKMANMSADELREYVSKLNIQNDYWSNVKKRNKESIGKGHAFINGLTDVAGSIVKDSAKNIGTQALTYILGAGVNKAFNENEKLNKVTLNEVGIVNPRKGQKEKK